MGSKAFIFHALPSESLPRIIVQINTTDMMLAAPKETSDIIRHDETHEVAATGKSEKQKYPIIQRDSLDKSCGLEYFFILLGSELLIRRRRIGPAPSLIDL
jgi:hypothetical protein